jgi:hypothetical protein
MKKIINKTAALALALLLGVVSACDEQLTEMNQDPLAIALEDGNVNLMLPAILGPAAMSYLSLGVDQMSGAMQHTQKSGWAGSHNYFDWNGQN